MARTEGIRLAALMMAAAILLAPAAGAREPDPDEQILLVRYACLVGGRNGAGGPAAAGVMSPEELSRFLLEWQPGSDNEEVRRVFALNRLAELARQAAQLPLAGGQVTGTYAHGGGSFEITMNVHPSEPAPADVEAITVAAEVRRNGELLSRPTIRADLGERAMIATADREQATFLFLVVEVDRIASSELRRRGLRHAWKKDYLLVDGEKVTAPVALEKTAPLYTNVARQEKIQGLVVLRLAIDREGRIEDVGVIQGQPYGLTEQAIEAVKKWRFTPALLEGEPVPVLYIITINFRLE